MMHHSLQRVRTSCSRIRYPCLDAIAQPGELVHLRGYSTLLGKRGYWHQEPVKDFGLEPAGSVRGTLDSLKHVGCESAQCQK
jgi:hypothetical protein